MPYRRRVDQQICHVYNRAAGRRVLFENSSDYKEFWTLLASAKRRARGAVALYGYCLMPNHWHLVICAEKTEVLSQFMRTLTKAHAVSFVRRHEKHGGGAVYQGRFRAVAVDRDAHFLALCRYVDRNPLRAGLVSTALEWPWSSMGGHCGACDPILDPSPVQLPSDWRAWVDTPWPSEPTLALVLGARPPTIGRPRLEDLLKKSSGKTF